jgi:hypothetical protein
MDMEFLPYPLLKTLGLTLRLLPGKVVTYNSFPDYFVEAFSPAGEEKILQRLNEVYPGTGWRVTTDSGYGFVQGHRKLLIRSFYDYAMNLVHTLVGNTGDKAKQEHAKEQLFSNNMYIEYRHVNRAVVMEILNTVADQLRYKETAKQVKNIHRAFGSKEQGKLLGSPNLGNTKENGLLALPANAQRTIGSYLGATTNRPRSATRSNYQGKMNELRRLYMGEPAQRKTRRRRR